jgi:hypothetical protein
MNKLLAFVLLDFKTVKPYLTVKNLLLLALVAMSLSAVNGTVTIGVGIGFMLGTLFVGYPFAIGEKNNLDTLYATLSINRKTVVVGRYLFAFAFDVCAVVFSFVFALCGLFVVRKAGVFQSGGLDSMALSVLMIFTQVIQVPIFFKFGYTKAKFITIIPFAGFMAGYAMFLSMAKAGGAAGESSVFLAGIVNNGTMPVFLTVLVLALSVYVSCSLSFLYYKKREF